MPDNAQTKNKSKRANEVGTVPAAAAKTKSGLPLPPPSATCCAATAHSTAHRYSYRYLETGAYRYGERRTGFETPCPRGEERAREAIHTHDSTTPTERGETRENSVISELREPEKMQDLDLKRGASSSSL